MKNAASIIAIAIATGSIAFSAITFLQVQKLQQSVEVSNQLIQKISLIPAQPAIAPTPTPSVATASQTPAATPAAIAPTTAATQSESLTQNAYSGAAKVTILAVKRIKRPADGSPDAGTPDIVNVQFRLSRIGNLSNAEPFNAGDTTARNPDTDEIYQIYVGNGASPSLYSSSENRATPSFSPGKIKLNASADGFVWLGVPENVKKIDISIPQAGMFKEVPIQNTVAQ